MNIKKSSFILTFVITLIGLTANAQDAINKSLQGRWVIKNPSDPSWFKVRFHAGHNHSQPSNLAVFNLCVDQKNKLYGRVTNNLLDVYDKNLKVVALSYSEYFSDFDMGLMPLNSSSSQIYPILVKVRLKPKTGKKKILVSFDGGELFYEATRKNNMPTAFCLNHMRNQKRKERSRK
jgi:hypothetical protein